MRKNNQNINEFRILAYSDRTFGNNGAFEIPSQNPLGQQSFLRVIASDGGGWDHVSVSLIDRCPTWDEMCFVKDFFFEPEETVVQYHPKASEYVNCHPYCLHLWRPNDGREIITPPTIYVGHRSSVKNVVI